MRACVMKREVERLRRSSIAVRAGHRAGKSWLASAHFRAWMARVSSDPAYFAENVLGLRRVQWARAPLFERGQPLLADEWRERISKAEREIVAKANDAFYRALLGAE